jgi:hypothetical protein
LGRRFRRTALCMPPTEGLRILQASLGILAHLVEQPGGLAQRLLGWLGSARLSLLQCLFLGLSHLPDLSQQAEHGIVG